MSTGKRFITKEDEGREMEIEFRTIEKLIGITWTFIEFEELKPDDFFRMFEKDKTPVKDINGETVFRAVSLPRACDPQGNFMIDTISNVRGEKI